MGPSDFERGDRNANLAAFQGVGMGRATPADDLVEAVHRLNKAADAARRAGWAVDLRFEDPGPNPNKGSVFEQVTADAHRWARLTAEINRKV